MSQERVRGSFVTAADVAARAGVSRSAVSRAFTPGASVSRDVRARVFDTATRLGYRVNRLAQSLIIARSNIVGLVCADLQQPFHAECLATLSAALLADGFQCMLLNAANAERDMGALIERVLEYRVCAIVVMNGTPPSRIVKECLDNGVPVILVNKPMPGFAVDTVVTDHAAGGRAAASSFSRLDAGVSLSSRAERGPRACWGVSTRSAIARPSRAYPCAFGTKDPPTIRRVARARWRCSPRKPSTEYFASPISSPSASSTLRVSIADAAVPDDLSVIGFDDIPQAAWNAYQLTTFRQPVRMLTDQVMEIMRQRAVTPESPRSVFKLPGTLVVRTTVRGLAAPESPSDPASSRRASGQQRGACGEQLGGVRGRSRRGSRRDRMRCAGYARRRVSDPSRSRDRGSTRRRARVRRGPGETAGPGPSRRAACLGAAQKIGLLVEVKDPDCAVAVGEMIAASSWRERIVIGGFHGPALAAVKARLPAVRTSLMMGSVVAPEDLARLATAYRADGVHLCWEARSPHPHRLLDAAAIRLLRNAGLDGHTVARRTRERIARVGGGFAPDAICTNLPAMLRRIVDGTSIAPMTREFDGERPRLIGGIIMNWKHALSATLAGIAVRRRDCARAGRGRRDQGLVARRSVRAAARWQHRRRRRHAEQDARRSNSDKRVKIELNETNAKGYDDDALDLLKAFAVDKGPDIFVLAHEWTGAFAEAGYALNLEDHIAKNPGALRRHHRAALAGGHLQGRALRRAAGFRSPHVLPEQRQAAQARQDRQGDRRASRPRSTPASSRRTTCATSPARRCRKASSSTASCTGRTPGPIFRC